MDNLILTTPEALEALFTRVLDSRIAQFTTTSTSSTPPTEIIDRETLIARLGVTEPTIIRHEKRGLIPFLTIGTAKRYNWPQVIKALENKKAKG